MVGSELVVKGLGGERTCCERLKVVGSELVVKGLRW